MDQYPQYPQDQQYQQYPAYQQPGEVPGYGNGKTSMIMGIISLVTGLFIFAIIGLVQANKAYALGYNYGKAKAGKITSIIGLIEGIIVFIYFIVMIALVASYY